MIVDMNQLEMMEKNHEISKNEINKPEMVNASMKDLFDSYDKILSKLQIAIQQQEEMKEENI